MTRRWRSLRGRWFTYLLLVFLAFASRFRWPLTELVDLDFHPVPYLLVIYLGYKAGPWLGALAGVLATLPWTAYAASEGLTGADLLLGSATLQPLENLPYVTVPQISLQYAALSGLLGFAAGWLCDLVERALGSQGLTLETLLPRRSRRSVLGWCLLRLQRWIRGADSEGPPQDEDGGGRRLLRKVLPGGVLLLVIVLNLTLSVPLVEPRAVLLIFPLPLLSAVLVLVFGFLTGSRTGVLCAVGLWVGSWLLFFAYGGDLFEATGFRPGVSVQSVAQVVGLAVLAWWAGTAGEIYRDEQRRERLRELMGRFIHGVSSGLSPSALLWVAVWLLSVGWAYEGGSLRLVYQPHLALFLVAALWASHRNRVAVSNWLFWLLLPFTLLWVRQPWSPFPETAAAFTIHPLRLDAVLLVLLAVVPLVVGRLDLTRRSVCRIASYGFLIAWTLHGLYLANPTAPEAQAVFLEWLRSQPSPSGAWTRVDSYPLLLVSWAAQILLFEAAARILHWAGKTPRTAVATTAG